VTNTRPTKQRIEETMLASDRLVLRAFEIINWFSCPWFMENPRGRMQYRAFMKHLPNKYLVCYCRYGTPFMKPTNIWSNVAGFAPLQCSKGKRCDSIVNGKHLRVIGNNALVNGRGVHKMREKHAVPPGLIRELFASAGLDPRSGSAGGV
jgi:hypothetical protein